MSYPASSRMGWRRWAVALLWIGALLEPSPGVAQTAAAIAPEAATGLRAAQPATRHARYAVVSANPLASQAAARMLAQGGSAMDAAIAAQWVLAVVEPQSSGLGGGGFVLHFDGTHVTAIDGREVAPQTATEDLFWVDGKPMPFAQAMVGGRAVGVPGLVKALEHAHQRHGSLPWATLFEPAMALASQGFAVSPRLHQLLQKDRFLRQDQQAAALYYLDDGNAVPVGHWLTNPRLAEVLKRLAREGSAALYHGPIAQRMVQAVRQHATNPGYLQHQDLQAYKPRVSKAMCFEYTSKPGVPYTICGMPPPSSGTLAVAQILGISRIAAGNRDLTWLAYLEAARLSFADRALYVADPAFVPAPAGDWLSLLTPGYLQHRAALIQSTAAAQVQAGDPSPWWHAAALTPAVAAMPEQPEYGTTHISVVDAQGRAVSLTSSIESAFGARLMVDGFLLNNQLTDFSFTARDAATGRPVANRVQPGKRPRSSMAPLMVWNRRTGHLAYVLGSPGGSMIIHYVARALQAMLDRGLSAAQAVQQRHLGVATSRRVWVERGRFDTMALATLEALGYTPQVTDLTSGLHILHRPDPQGPWLSGVDPRREGSAAGL